MVMAYTRLDSPVGRLKLVGSSRGLAAVLWPDDPSGRVRLGAMDEVPDHPVLVQAGRELHQYFTADRRTFSVPLDFHGTDFQKQVWRALLAIPFGETRTYGQIAAAQGNPKASRAVGAANGRNPISIIAPCHRVVGSDGSLTGFAGGMAAKAWLLRHEGRA